MWTFPVITLTSTSPALCFSSSGGYVRLSDTGSAEGETGCSSIGKDRDTDARRSSGKAPCPRWQDRALVNSWGRRARSSWRVPVDLGRPRKPGRRSGARQRGRVAVPGPRLGREAGAGIRAARRGWPRRARGGRARPERGWPLADDWHQTGWGFM